MTNTRVSMRDYRYIDDTGSCWRIHLFDYLAEAGGLEPVPEGNPEGLKRFPRNYTPRQLNVVALADRPGRQKYRTHVVTNQRDPSYFFGRTIMVSEFEMRWTRFVGEQRKRY